MRKIDWIGRDRAAINMACPASIAEARLIEHGAGGDLHPALTTTSFMLAATGPATDGEGAALLPPGRGR